MCQHVPLREAPRVAPPPSVIPMVRQPSTDASPGLESIFPARHGHVVPASVAATKPPLDAGLDGGAPLPPVPLPDGGLLHDAGAPMQ
ncbi:MAG TPA: hypothetical protein VMJ10_13600 [Kofleriaceae bacterium]|nr:hypothetical protein [Kofleriaceae bacterium]